MRLLKCAILAALLISVTTSCGGGGGSGSNSTGGGSTPQPTASPPTTPTITSSSSSTTTEQQVTFRASATDPGNLALTYSWDFGDGTTDSGATVTKTYSKAGSFTVKVTATNSAARSSSSTIVQTVTWRELKRVLTRRAAIGSTEIRSVSRVGDGGGITGDFFIAGTTCCMNSVSGQPTTFGQDGFISRINTDGTAAWTRLIGGSSGAGLDASENVHAVLATIDGVYVVGSTDAKDFYGQTQIGSRDVFVIKFSNDGTRIFAKLYGGIADDEALGITIGKPVGSRETLNITGVTRSASFEGQPSNGSRDAFVLQIDTNGALIWARLTGGSGDDIANDIALSRDGAIYITGSTSSTSIDGQQLNNQRDAFVAKLNSDGSKVWTRLIGGSNYEDGYGIDLDADGSNAYLTGFTDSQIIEGTAANNTGGGLAGDAFVSKIASDGTKVWTRTLGSSGVDLGRSVKISSDGSIYIAGITDSTLFDSKATNGGKDIFLTKYVSDGTRAYTLIGGGVATDRAYDITTLGDGSILVVGDTDSPTVDGQTTVKGVDGLIIKYAF